MTNLWAGGQPDFGGDLNRSMQHLISNYREEDVENEVSDENLLHTSRRDPSYDAASRNRPQSGELSIAPTPLFVEKPGKPTHNT